ncbi:hypothetical protein P7C73_g5010, partial [Tremellales sp. Uapishka_1]
MIPTRFLVLLATSFLLVLFSLYYLSGSGYRTPSHLKHPSHSLLSPISAAYETARLSLLATYSPASTSAKLAIPHPLDPSLPHYLARLQTFLARYFAHSPHYEPLQLTLSQIELHIPPPLAEDALPQVIFTTAIQGEEDDMHFWEERLGNEWEVRIGGDADIQGWYENCTIGEEIVWDQVWTKLGMTVLKNDLVR